MRNKNIIAKSLAIIAATSLSGYASASLNHVIDFNGFAGTNIPGSTSYLEGFQTFFENNSIATIDGFSINPNGFHDFSPGRADLNNLMVIDNESYRSSAGGDGNDIAWNGTDYATFLPEIFIERSDHEAFTLNSLDLVPWIFGFGVTEATVTGNFLSGGTITQVLSLDTTPNQLKLTGNDFTKYVLTGFINLTSFGIVANGSHHLAVDNIDVSFDTLPVSAVPELETYAMLMAGLTFFGFSSAARRLINK